MTNLGKLLFNHAFFRGICRTLMNSGESPNETYLPTFRCPSQAHARFPRSFAYPWWSCCAGCSSRQGPSSSGCLSLRVRLPDTRTTLPDASFDPVGTTVIPSRYRFSRTSRLLKPSEFQTVFDARKACRGQWLTVHRTEASSAKTVQAAEHAESITNDNAASRLGLIVAKRLVPAAARRNLIRRVVREYFRTTRDAFPPGDWIVRLHESPFPSPARIRKGTPVPTRLQVVTGLRADLTQILERVAKQIRKTSLVHDASDV